MLNMQQHLSAIASLRNQLAAGHIANLTDFWREAESLNVPLVTPVEGPPRPSPTPERSWQRSAA